MLDSSTLSYFTGTENYLRYSPLGRKVLLTDGARYVAENGGKGTNSAWWLVDIFAFLSPAMIQSEGFIVGKLIPDKTGTGATFIAEDGNGRKLHKQHIEYTDFDFAGAGATAENPFALWFIDGVLLLPSEY